MVSFIRPQSSRIIEPPAPSEARSKALNTSEIVLSITDFLSKHDRANFAASHPRWREIIGNSKAHWGGDVLQEQRAAHLRQEARATQRSLADPRLGACAHARTQQRVAPMPSSAQHLWADAWVEEANQAPAVLRTALQKLLASPAQGDAITTVPDVLSPEFRHVVELFSSLRNALVGLVRHGRSPIEAATAAGRAAAAAQKLGLDVSQERLFLHAVFEAMDLLDPEETLHGDAVPWLDPAHRNARQFLRDVGTGAAFNAALAPEDLPLPEGAQKRDFCASMLERWQLYAFDRAVSGAASEVYRCIGQIVAYARSAGVPMTSSLFEGLSEACRDGLASLQVEAWFSRLDGRAAFDGPGAFDGPAADIRRLDDMRALLRDAPWDHVLTDNRQA